MIRDIVVVVEMSKPGKSHRIHFWNIGILTARSELLLLSSSEFLLLESCQTSNNGDLIFIKDVSRLVSKCEV